MSDGRTFPESSFVSRIHAHEVLHRSTATHAACSYTPFLCRHVTAPRNGLRNGWNSVPRRRHPGRGRAALLVPRPRRFHSKDASKMRAEMDSVLGPDKDKLPVYADLANLKYCMAIFLETLRIWSNVPLNLKTPTQVTTLPGSGMTVYPGQRLSHTTFGMGRSKRIWGPDAKEFKPERWLDEKGGLRREDSFKYPAFNAGPRICLGMDSEFTRLEWRCEIYRAKQADCETLSTVAKQEAMVLMCAIFRRFDLQVVREDDPGKWGDFEKKLGRYDLQASLAVRKALDVKVVAL